MGDPPGDYVFPDRWSDLRGHDRQVAERRQWLSAELQLELGPSDPIVQTGVLLGEFDAQDEVLVQVGERYVLVHPTMAQKRDHYVSMRWYESWTEVATQVQHMNDEW